MANKIYRPRPQDFDEGVEYAEAVALYEYESERYEEYKREQQDVDREMGFDNMM